MKKKGSYKLIILNYKLLILSFGLLFLLSPQVYANGEGETMMIIGGDITLTIQSTFAGENPTSVIDTSCSLFWESVSNTKRKITVKTNLASPKFTLKVLATDVLGGTAEPEVTLSTIAQDFITNIPPKTTGSCDLNYTASATAAQGMGTDIHVITYTITNQ